MTGTNPEQSSLPPRRPRPAAMSDVAALAGVSQMTVSRVINERSGVHDDTRSKVLAAMRELDYRPNVAARALVTGRSRTLGVVSFDTTLYGPASMLHGIDQAARFAGYFVSIASMRALDRRSMQEAIGRLYEQAVDGIIVIAPQVSTADALRNLAIEMPAVVVQGGPNQGAPVAGVDQYAGAARATEHLLSLGHETVWHISGPDDWVEAGVRSLAWRETLVAAEREVPTALVGDWSPLTGYQHGRTLAAAREASAVFVANDQMALGVLRALYESGLRVPDDVSVVGFDDVPEAAYFSPPLTTVRQDFGELGRRSLRLLLEQIEGRTLGSSDVLIEPELLLRGSSGPVRSAAGLTTDARNSADPRPDRPPQLDGSDVPERPVERSDPR